MKKIFSFYGGVFPSRNKFTSDVPIDEMPSPKKVVIPLLQHKGTPSRPLVSKGDTVLLGQKIAEAADSQSVPQHASVSGRVTDVCQWLHPVTGKPAEAIVIESDLKDTRYSSLRSHSDYYSYSHQELASVIREAGIVGMGGEAVPTHLKLIPPSGSELDTLVINGTECEPYITADDRLMQEHAKEVVEGAKLIMFILGAIKTVIAIDENNASAIRVLKKIVFNEPNIDLVLLKTRYPQGSEKQLIKTITGREVPPGQTSHKKGVVVNNVATAYAISRALKEGEPLTARIVTVSGPAVKAPKNVKVRIGTLARDLAAYCGTSGRGVGQFIVGGPMKGVAQHTLDVPMIKGTAGVIFFHPGDVIDNKYYDCFRCGKCARVCPAKLFPGIISVSVQNNNLDEAKKHYPMDCIECGCCAYICPAKRPIVQQVRWAKQEIQRSEEGRPNG
jgi:electron transport complex protein RnfC